MSIKEILQYGQKELGKASITTPQLDAEVLLSFVLKKSKEWLYTNDHSDLSEKDISKYEKLIERRKKFEPIAYITNHKEFFGLDFYIDKKVLIPRPETEILVENAIKIVKDFCKKGQDELVIADIGTGSGCIAISVTKNIRDIPDLKFKLYCTDISRDALKIAKQNAENQKVADKITFLEGNLLLPTPEKIDLILSNPPYVLENEKVSPEVRFEPKQAVFVKKQGFFREFIAQIDEKLENNGICLIELGNQKQEIQNIIDRSYPNIKIDFINDYSKFPRFVKFEK